MQDGAVTLLEAEMRDWPYAAADAQQDATKYLARAVPDLQARLQRIRNCRGAGDEEGLRRERAEFPYATEELDAAAAVRSGLNNLFIFSKLREARSRLYRRQILQVNIRWKALDEIYKMYILLHRSDIKN